MVGFTGGPARAHLPRICRSASFRAPRRLIASLSVPLLISGCAAATKGADPWWGTDKALHLGVSAAAGAAGVGVATAAWGDEPIWARGLIGAGLGFGVGLVKEAADLAGLGTPSGKDLTWDLVGAVGGATITALVIYAVESAGDEDEEDATPGEALPAGGAVWQLPPRYLSPRYLSDDGEDRVDLPHHVREHRWCE